VGAGIAREKPKEPRQMKQTSIKATALLASLMPATSVMAHSEVNGHSGLMTAAHDLVHSLQANPWLPAILFALVFAAFFISRKSKRES
jgi:hypothetical protein